MSASPSTVSPCSSDGAARSPTASLWRRLAAMIYDSFLLTALSMLYSAITLVCYVSLYGHGTQDYAPMMGGTLFQLGWIGTIIGFFCYFWRRAGQTVGMRAWRIKVVDAHERTPSLCACFIRCLAAALSVLAFGLGYLWSLWDKQGESWHDKLSNTHLIVTPKTRKR